MSYEHFVHPVRTTINPEVFLYFLPKYRMGSVQKLTGIMLRTISLKILLICYLAIFASEEVVAQTQFVATGANTYQNGLVQFVITEIGILFTWSERQIKFVAYDPNNLPEGTHAIFFNWKSNQFSEVRLGQDTHLIRGTVGLDSPNMKFLVDRGLLRVLVNKNTMVAFYGTNVLGFVSDAKLLEILFNMDKASNFGTYELNSNTPSLKLYLDGAQLKNNAPIGLNLKSESRPCGELPLISAETADRLKAISDPAQAKAYLSKILKQEGQKLRDKLESTIFVRERIGLAAGTAELINVEEKSGFCILNATPLS